MSSPNLTDFTKHPDDFEKYDIFMYNLFDKITIARVLDSSSYSFDFVNIWSELLYHSARQSYIKNEKETYFGGEKMKDMTYLCTVYTDDKDSILYETKKQFPELFI